MIGADIVFRRHVKIERLSGLVTLTRSMPTKLERRQRRRASTQKPPNCPPAPAMRPALEVLSWANMPHRSTWVPPNNSPPAHQQPPAPISALQALRGVQAAGGAQDPRAPTALRDYQDFQGILDFGTMDRGVSQQSPAAQVGRVLNNRDAGYVTMGQDRSRSFTQETDPAAALLHTEGLSSCTALVIVTAREWVHEIRMLHTPWSAIYIPALLEALLDPDTRMVLIKTPAGRNCVEVQGVLDSHARAPAVLIPYNSSRAPHERGNTTFAVSAAATDQGFYVNFTDNTLYQHVRHVEPQPLATPEDRRLAQEETTRAIAAFTAADTTLTAQQADLIRSTHIRCHH